MAIGGLFLASLSVLSSGFTSSLAGTYEPDFSRASRKDRPVLETIFQGSLFLGRDGTFLFPSTQIQGFWRVKGESLALINQGFFRLTFAIPNEVLRKSWPKSQLEGFVMNILPTGTLRLASVGALTSPVLFHRAERRTTRELLAQSRSDETSGNSLLAYAILADEKSTRCWDLLEIIKDPHASTLDRTWAPAFLEPAVGKNCQLQMLSLIDLVDQYDLTSRDAGLVRRILAIRLSESRDPDIAARLIAVGMKWKLRPSILAEGIANAKYVAGIPHLIEWTRAKEESTRRAAFKALGKVQGDEALSAIRSLKSDETPAVRLAALGALAALAPDPAEQRAAILGLISLKDKGDYFNTRIIEALGDSESRLAVPYLVAFLETAPDEYDRRKAAEALGKLAIPEAVPALIQAKLGRSSQEPMKGPLSKKLPSMIDDAIDDSQVRKAAAEALWKIQNRRT